MKLKSRRLIVAPGIGGLSVRVEGATTHSHASQGSTRRREPSRRSNQLVDATAVTSRCWCKPRPERSRAHWVFLLVGLLLHAHASAQSLSDPQVREREVKTLARVLAYDENLAGRAGSRVVLAVLYKPGGPDLEKEGAAWFAFFSQLESYTARGLPFHVIMLPFTTAEALEKSIADLKVVALYVCPGLEGDIAAIKRVSQKRKSTTIASREEQVTAGLALGVFSDHGKLVVVVNLPAARAEGAQFGSDLLRLAKVVQ
jgi:YfiR/HmsC-like